MTTQNGITAKHKGKVRQVSKTKFAHCEPQNLQELARHVIEWTRDMGVGIGEYYDIVFDYETARFYAVAECNLPNAQPDTYYVVQVFLEAEWHALNDLQKADALDAIEDDAAEYTYKITSPSTVVPVC